MIIVFLISGAVTVYLTTRRAGGANGIEGMDTVGVELVLGERGEGGGGEKVLMVRGRVANTSLGAKQKITVKAQVLDSAGVVVEEKEAPCGKTWTAIDIGRLTRDEIAAEYQQLEGEDRLIRPDGEITCSVVLDAVPPGLTRDYRARLVVTRADTVTYQDP